MWCSQCQADVATEVSADGRNLLCTICGESVRKVFAPSQHPETQSARELLERWSRNQLLEPAVDVDDAEEATEPVADSDDETALEDAITEYSPAALAEPPAPPSSPEEESGADLLPSPRSSDPSPTERPVRKIHRGGRSPVKHEPTSREPKRAAPKPALNWRIDAAHQDAPRQHTPAPAHPPAARPHFEETAYAAHEREPIAQVARRDDFAHEAAPRPHFALDSFTQPSRKPGRQESVFGQLLAYVGVGLLTIGTALVVWGYFGGPQVARYQSTGWLISTAGQMLLFLGVVTLVSGGMQQTTHEVSQRVEYLGNKMHRIEQSTEELLKGPYFAKARSGERATHRDDSAHSES